MVETFVFDIAGGILSNVLGSLATEEVKLFWGAKEDLQKLTDKLSIIKAVVVDAEEQQAKREPVRLWLERLSNVLYEADDFMDAVSTEALRRKLKTQHKKAKGVRTFFSKSNQFAFRLKMAHKIKEISENLNSIIDEIKSLQFVMRPEEPPITVMGRDSTYSFVCEEGVIGRKKDKDAIIKSLLDTNVERNVSIIPIVGIGGLGKTTLAQYVYNDKKIRSYFELQMWIFVSDPFIVQNIVERILESIIGKKPKSLQMDTLVKDLKENIDDKKYLLVLDDVWNEDAEQWSKLETVLMDGAIGIKILVTTRSERVAKIMFSGKPYSLEGLSDLASLDLLKRMAFSDGEWPDNPRIMELGKEIIKKCVGVPLAVKTMGRMLYFKNSEMEWLSFLNNELPDVQNDQSGILSTLKLSYDKLPAHLKRCFTYCSTYPKDYEYDKTTIIYEWIAHGFIKSSSKNQCLEDVGNNYFMELLWRLFFQDPKENSNHVIIRCKMHDLIHDLATSVMARSLITISDEEKWNINEKARHLSICNHLSFPIKELISQCKGRMIRTFHCPKFRGEINCKAIFSSFKFLRVLNLSNNYLEHVPNTIGKLKHLRYLDLSYNRRIKVLPHSCTKLVNLQFLKLSHCEALKELPRDIKNLVNLTHLDFEGCWKITYLPRGLGQLGNLQSLTRFWIDWDSEVRHSVNFSELKGLNKLRGKLEILNLKHSKEIALKYEAANINEKKDIECLTLQFEPSDEVNSNDVEDERFEGLQPHATLKQLEISCYRRSRLPKWVSLITGLVKLSVSECHGCQYLPPLSQLPLLKQLYIIKMNALDYISDSSTFEEFFPSLSKFKFEECPNLKGWCRDSCSEVDSEGDHYIEKVAGHHTLPLFPKLSEVEILQCPMLTSLPLSPCIEKLYLFGCSGKLLQQIMTANSTVVDPSFALLSNLKDIILVSLEGLKMLQQEWLKNLTSLETLKIRWCSELKSLSTGIQHLTALEVLDISWCTELDLVGDEHGMFWPGLKSLHSLKLSGLPKLVSLPWGLQHVGTIQYVSISYCKNLTIVVESILNWKSFKVLRIQECPSLIELPTGIERPAFQLRLRRGNPSLLERYEKDESTDWDKMTDISELSTE